MSGSRKSNPEPAEGNRPKGATVACHPQIGILSAAFGDTQRSNEVDRWTSFEAIPYEGGALN